jgi:hypothetical protein
MLAEVMGIAPTVEVSGTHQTNAKISRSVTHMEMLLSWTRLPSPSNKMLIRFAGSYSTTSSNAFGHSTKHK